MAVTVLACYDVRDNDRRAKVAARLQRDGDRIQFSVFLCSVSPDNLPALVADVSALIDPDEDSFLVLRQCGACWDGRAVVGQSQPPTPELFWAVF